VFKKLLVAWVTLALIVGLVVPAYADVKITGSLGYRLNGYNLSNPPGLSKANLEGRLWLTLQGNVNDFITYRADVYIGYANLALWQSPSVSTTTTTINNWEDTDGDGAPDTYTETTVLTGASLGTSNLLRLNRAFITADLTSKGMPIKIEGGYLNISTYGHLAIFSDSFNIGNVPGINITSSTLLPGFTTFLLLSPDVDSATDNQTGVALGVNYSGDWGSVTGIGWTRNDKTTSGYRISGKWNIVPNILTLYGLYGQRAGDTEAKYQVVGVNLPVVNTQIGWNPYLEYDLYNKALGFYVSKTLATNVSTSIYLVQDTTTKEWKLTPYLSFSF